MVEVDLTTTILPLVVAIVVPFVLLSINKFSKTSEGTVTGSIRLEGLRSNVDEVKEEMMKGFARVENILEKREAKWNAHFNNIDISIQEITKTLTLHEYRLDLAEKDRMRRGQKNDDKQMNGGGSD